MDLITSSPEEVSDLEALFDAHYRELLGLANLLTRSGAAAEDAVQQAYVNLCRTSSAPAAGSERAYLRASVVNECRKLFRRRQLRWRFTPDEGPPEPSAEQTSMIRHRDARILSTIDELPRRQRECVVLHYFEELTDTEIGELLGISAGSVKTHLHRARARLRERLEDLA